MEKEQAFARADEPERKKESKKKLQKQKVFIDFINVGSGRNVWVIFRYYKSKLIAYFISLSNRVKFSRPRQAVREACSLNSCGKHTLCGADDQ